MADTEFMSITAKELHILMDKDDLTQFREAIIDYADGPPGSGNYGPIKFGEQDGGYFLQAGAMHVLIDSDVFNSMVSDAKAIKQILERKRANDAEI